MSNNCELRAIAIYGFPIAHSLSPVMHNAGFKELGVNYTYLPFRVHPADLKDAITAIKALDFKGANITVPHKEEALDLLDEVTEDAFIIGAVNTIDNVGGRLVGYNTDCRGFVLALKEAGVTRLNKQKAVILGAGGASKAACVGLLREQVKRLVIANRTLRKAELIRDNFKKSFPRAKISVCPLRPEELGSEFEDCGLLVNTTSVGMNNDCLNLPLDSLNKDALVYDMVYNPPKTKLLKRAEKLGLKTQNGLDMLLYQGVLGFEIWTKRTAPAAVMKEALYKAAYTK